MPRGRKPGTPKGPRRMVNSERAIASLEQQAKFWEERAAKMRQAVTDMLNELREAERGGRTIGLPRGPGRPPGNRTRAPRGQGVGAVTAQILAEWKRPARVNDLLPELEKRGARVGGKRPSATLNSTLLKFSGVKRVARGLFAHASWSGDVAAAAAATGGAPAKRGPGRPRKVATPATPGAPAAATPDGATPAVKRGPGRPRKNPAGAAAPAKRGPGRPPKRGPGRPPKSAKKGRRGRKAKIVKMPEPKQAAATPSEPAAPPTPAPAQG